MFAAVVGMTLAMASPAGAAQAKISPYKGFGTWIDIFDKPAFQKPKEVVAAIVARGVKTIYLETSNYSQDVAIVRPAATGKLLEAAHAAGLDVVAWYLPSFTRVKRDLSRSLAAIAFRSANGQAFDSFALDIESALVSSAALRNTRLLTVSRGIRAGGRRYIPARGDHPLAAWHAALADLLAGLPLCRTRGDLRRDPADVLLHLPCGGRAPGAEVHDEEHRDHPGRDREASTFRST